MPIENADFFENDPRLIQALNEIYSQYGVVASITAKAKSLRKFGERSTVGTGTEVVATTIGSLTDYPLISTNGVVSVVSSDAADTQNVELYEGHTISDGALSFRNYTTDFALTGQTPVTLPLAMRDVTRARISAPANGTIYFFQGGAVTAGVPNDLTTVHAVIPAGERQTQKTQTAISNLDFFIMTGATCSVLSKVAAWAQSRIDVKDVSHTYFYPKTQWFGTKDSSGTVQLIGPNDPYIIVPNNHDVRQVVQTNAGSVDVSAGFQGFIAAILG